MAGVKVRGYGSLELDEQNTRVLDVNKPIRIGDLYRDNSLEIGE